MAFIISGTVEIGRPLIAHSFSLGNIVAFFRANIDRSLLDNWLNLAELQAQFPNRIDVAGSMVSFRGPVAIIQSATTFKVDLIGLTALIGVAAYFASKQLLTSLANHEISVCSDSNREKISWVAAASITLMIGCFLYTSAIVTMPPGVYFLT